MSDLPNKLSKHIGKGYVIAPAGFGKTHLIAEAVKCADNRQLVLTHTYAGVNALKSKMRKHNVSASKYRVDTIASWALRLCLSYPNNSGWGTEHPNGNQWQDLYQHCSKLLETNFIKRIIHSSYGAVYVDEYQDCTISQHCLVLKLASILPICIMGDPLQGIFGFASDRLVNWDTQIFPEFNKLGELDIPWRWKNARAEEIGIWLGEVRQNLLSGKSIDLTNNIPTGITVHFTSSDEEIRNKQINTCKYFKLPYSENVVAIHKGDSRYKAKCHKLAKNTSGRFSSIEEMEGKRLFSFIKKYKLTKTTQERLLLAIEFACKQCMSGVNNALSVGTKRGEMVVVKGNTKTPDLVRAANRFLETDAPNELREFFIKLKEATETKLYSRDLFNRLLKVLLYCITNKNPSLEDAAKKFQKAFRHTGRPVRYPKLIGTTLLLKGLEFDHAIVLDAVSLSKKDLYVAITRGSKSLTIISSSKILSP